MTRCTRVEDVSIWSPTQLEYFCGITIISCLENRSECINIISKKPLFRTIFLQNLQQQHADRKNIKKDNRQNYIGLTQLLIEGLLWDRDLSIQKKRSPLDQLLIDSLNSNFTQFYESNWFSKNIAPPFFEKFEIDQIHRA